MLYLRKLITSCLLMLCSIVSVQAQDSKLSMYEGLKFIEVEPKIKKLAAFNVSSKILDNIGKALERYGITLSSSYSVQDAEVLLYVVEQKKELRLFLPHNFVEPDEVTDPLTMTTLKIKKTDGTKSEITRLLAVRALAPQVTDEKFDCFIVKSTVAALAAPVYNTEISTIARDVVCDF